jgi:hypothetical protein
VLTLRVPVSPESKPRKIAVGSTDEGGTAQDSLPEGSEQSEDSPVGAGSR